MLESALWILLVGLGLSRIAGRLRIPPLVGMMGAGILLGPQVWDRINAGVLAAADDLRTFAVMVILMKAGLGLDREKLARQGSVALRLGFLPATGEMIVVAVAAVGLLQFDWGTGLLLGCILGAESPAVIVPGMLRLKSWGWGVAKGIPDAILTGSALSDVLLLLVFSLLMTVLAQETATGVALLGGIRLSPLQVLPLQLILQIALGVGVGWSAARSLAWALTQGNWTQGVVQDLVVAAGLALVLVIGAERLPLYSGYLAVMAMGFFLIDYNAPLARRLRGGFDSLWGVAQIFLFVLMGASIQLQILEKVLGVGLVILALGTLVGRMAGWILSTWGSDWSWRERLFLLPGNAAKATVQAAIGAIPLAAGIEGGEIILAISALSILVTAPLGAWGIPTFAPRLLEKGEVDPTKVTVERSLVILAAVDVSPQAQQVLSTAADLARRGDAEVIVLHVMQSEDPQGIQSLQATTQQILADIRHQFQIVSGPVVEEILRAADGYQASEIVIGKREQSPLDQVWVGSVSRAVLESSSIPVLVVD